MAREYVIDCTKIDVAEQKCVITDRKGNLYAIGYGQSRTEARDDAQSKIAGLSFSEGIDGFYKRHPIISWGVLTFLCWFLFAPKSAK